MKEKNIKHMISISIIVIVIIHLFNVGSGVVKNDVIFIVTLFLSSLLIFVCICFALSRGSLFFTNIVVSKSENKEKFFVNIFILFLIFCFFCYVFLKNLFQFINK